MSTDEPIDGNGNFINKAVHITPEIPYLPMVEADKNQMVKAFYETVELDPDMTAGIFITPLIIGVNAQLKEKGMRLSINRLVRYLTQNEKVNLIDFEHTRNKIDGQVGGIRARADGKLAHLRK